MIDALGIGETYPLRDLPVPNDRLTVPFNAAAAIRVEDSGVGMSATPGAGTGLENVRSRLALAFGAASGLALQDGEPTGLVADITIPHTIA